MEIPKQLNGKVQKFIDEVNRILKETDVDYDTQCIDIIKIEDFYNRPFNPHEDIQKYFDKKFGEIIQYYPIKDGKMWFSNTRPRFTFPKPKTLGDFVNNCLQADIILEWKE